MIDPVVPVKSDQPKPVTPPIPPPTDSGGAKKESGGWCSLLGGIVAFLFFGVIAFGGAIGFAFMGGPPQTPFNPGLTSLPSLPVATATPTASPQPTSGVTPQTTDETSSVSVRVRHQQRDYDSADGVWVAAGGVAGGGFRPQGREPDISTAATRPGRSISIGR